MKVLAGWLLAALGAACHAHGGGLDKNGCHHDRKHGGYHCHRAEALAPAPAASAATQAVAPPQQPPAPPACYVGPKGSTYTLTKNGKKNYGGC